MSLEDFYILLLIILLLMVSAFFSGSETGLTAANATRIHELAKRNNRRAQTLEWLFGYRNRLLGVLLTGNNFVNILASALATVLATKIFGTAGVLWVTLVMTALVLIFAEVLPKTYALAYADQVALAVAPIFKVLLVVLRPVVWCVDASVHAILKACRINLQNGNNHAEREEALLGAIKLHDGGDPEHVRERQMLRSILDLDEMDISAVMTHRSKVVMMDADTPTEHILQQVSNMEYSRIPFFRGDQDNIIGILNLKTLSRTLLRNQGQPNQGQPIGEITDLLAPPWFIPDTTTLLEQLKAFQQRHEHAAIVIDEYGSFEGIVTLEDILEQIVGEISDEHDNIHTGLREVGGQYIVDGALPIRELNRVLDAELPDDEADTVAGLVIHEARLIPLVGQVFVFYGYRFEILQRQRHQITRLRVTPDQG